MLKRRLKLIVQYMLYSLFPLFLGCESLLQKVCWSCSVGCKAFTKKNKQWSKEFLYTQVPKICQCFSFYDIFNCKQTFFNELLKGNHLTDFEKTLIENFRTSLAVLSFYLNISQIFRSWDLILTIWSKIARLF